MVLLVTRIIVELVEYASKMGLDPAEVLRYVSAKISEIADILE